MIWVNHINKSIQKRQILQNINLAIKPGCIIGIIGHNGAGKTTLLRILAGLIPPETGVVKIMGQLVRYDNKLSRQQIGYMPEDGGLYKRLNVRNNIKFALQFYSQISDSDKLVDRYLNLFNLAERQDENVGKLSGGMRRKVLFIKSVVSQPKVLLLDEPFTGFDVESRQAVISCIQEIRNRGGVICISSHSTGELEKICDAYLFIRNGNSIFQGQLQDLYNRFPDSEKASLASLYLQITEKE